MSPWTALAIASETEAPSEAVEISYEAPEGCPSPRDFSWQVSARVGGVRAPRPGEAARQFRVKISIEEDGRHVGVLDIANTDGSTGDRNLQAADCAEVSNALALIVALAIDPHAKAELPSTSPPPSGEAKTDVEQKPPATTRDAEARTEPRSTRVPEAPSARRGASSVSLGGGLEAQALGGPAPDVLLGAGAFGQMDFVRDSVFAPSLRVSFSVAPESTRRGEQGAASFAWLAGELAACPVRIRFGERVSATPCASMEAGAVIARGSETTNPRADSRPWLTPRLEGEVDVRVVSGVRLQLHGGAGFPLVRDDYVIGAEVVHTVPPASWGAGVRLGVFSQ